MVALIIILVLVVLLVGFVVVGFNKLRTTDIGAQEALGGIDVQLTRRADLIPNLVNTVKGYASHEKNVFEDVTEARANALSAQTVPEAAKADNQFQAALKSLFAVAEAYPQLRASENFQQLSSEITDTEDKIQAARRFYNGAARDLNTKIQTFPTNIFAGMLGFKQRDFFEVDAGEQAAVNQAPDVEFNDDSADSKPNAKK